MMSIPIRQAGFRYIPALFLLILFLISGIAAAEPSFSPSEGKMPLTVKFSFPGGETCDSVSWDFGDDSKSTEVAPSHVYKAMGFYYPQCICTLPGATITYNFYKIVASNADMPDADTHEEHYPVGTTPVISPETLSLDEQKKQADGLYALGLTTEAADSYKKVIQMSGNDATLLGKYGDILSGLSRWNEAAVAYNQSLSIKPDPAVLNAYGAMLLKLNKYQQALDVFNQTIAIDAANPTAYTGIGKAYELLKKEEEAAAAYNKSTGLDDTQPSAWVGYGNVLNTLGKYQESVTAYEKAIALGVTGAEIYNKYGGVLRKMDRDADATKAMEKARSFQGQLNSHADDYIPRCGFGGMG